MASIVEGDLGKGTLSLASKDGSGKLELWEIGRPRVGPSDVAIDILYCGMCHSDCHACNGDWPFIQTPIAPGHEISGQVREVGPDVTNFKVGDVVGVGCMVDSCRTCEECSEHLQQFCRNGMTMTYGSVFPEGRGDNFCQCVGRQTNGGYSTDIVVNQDFVFHLPKSMKPECAGVLLCAGITMYSPLNKHIKSKGLEHKNKHVGIVGFGGLGQMGVKLAKAMGCRVTVLSRNTSKREAAEKLGAEILVHGDEDAMKAAARTFDLILDTVSAPHDIQGMLSALKVGGTHVFVGGVTQPYQVDAMQMLFNGIGIEGTLIGGLRETQEMLDFCAQHNIVPEYKVIHAKDASAHFQDMMAGTSDAMRAVIDISTIKELV